MDLEHEPKQPRKSPIYFYTFLSICVMAISILGWQMARPPVIFSPIPDSKPTPKPARNIFAFFLPKKNPDDLKEIVGRAINGKWKNYSIYIKDYNSDFTYGINETVIYTAASVNKVAILAALYYQVQTGAIDLDHQVTVQESDVQDYGTGSIRYDPPGSVYSVKTLAKLMMQQSDNTAAYILANYIVGLDKIQSLVSGWGMTQTDMVNNKTSNRDMAIILEKIYNGKIANVAYTQEMLAFMQDSDFEDRLPALLPKDTLVYHKIGTEQGVLHDVGIIESAKNKYYLGILTSDISSEPETTKTMAEVSKAIFDFMKR